MPDADPGILSNTARDIIALVGLVLAVVPLFAVAKAPSGKAAVITAARQKRLALLPAILVLTAPIAIAGWFVGRSNPSVGFLILGIPYLLSWFLCVPATLSIIEILSIYNYSLSAMAIVCCGWCGIVVTFIAILPTFPLNAPDMNGLTFFGAVLTILFPVILGGAMALLFAMGRLFWQAFN